MSLDTVAEDITSAARSDAEAIQQDANEHADRITAEAESDAEAIVSEREAEVEQQIERERDRTMSSATLEAKQKRLAARRDELEALRETVETHIAGLEGNTRESLTRTLLDDAAAEFENDSSIRVFGRADDEALLRSILAEDAYENFAYAGEYDCLGGVVVESEAARIRSNNTFDSVLDSVWDANLQQVSTRLFDS